MRRLIDTEDYETLLAYYTAEAIDRIEDSLNDTTDIDELKTKIPALIESTVSHTKVDDSDDHQHGEFAGDHVFQSRVWADNRHDMTFFASMLDADRQLFQNIDGRELDCEAWRTDWRWFANKDRFDHTSNIDPTGPVLRSDDDYPMPNNPFTALQAITFGLVCARVYERVGEHYKKKLEEEDAKAEAA